MIQLLYFSEKLIQIYDLEELNKRDYDKSPLEALNFLEFCSQTGYHPNSEHIQTFSLRLVEQMSKNLNLTTTAFKNFKQVILKVPRSKLMTNIATFRTSQKSYRTENPYL